MNQGIPFWAVLLWVLVAVLPLAMVVWVIRRFLQRPRLSIWQGIVGLLVWLSMIGVFIFSLLVGLGGHSPRYFDVVSTTVLLVQLVACIGFIWYLYIKLGFK